MSLTSETFQRCIAKGRAPNGAIYSNTGNVFKEKASSLSQNNNNKSNKKSIFYYFPIFNVNMNKS